MRILVDEDLASRSLISQLRRQLGDDLIEPEFGATDEAVWQRAPTERAAVLTGNVVDFLGFTKPLPYHHGLLLVYRSNDRRTDMRASDIAAAVLTIAGQYPDGVEQLVLALNDFRTSN